jgi:phage tail sheath protein FI
LNHARFSKGDDHMATTYLSPGVYVEEVDKGTKPIQVLGASMPAFLGITAQASRKYPQTGAPDPDGLVLGKAQLITNWTQYSTIFGGFVKGAYLPDAVYGYFNNGGGPCYVTSLRTLEEDQSENAAKASCEIPADGSSAAAEPEKGEEDKGQASKKSIPRKDMSFVVEAKVGGNYGTQIELFIEHERDHNGQPTGTFYMQVDYPSAIGKRREEKTGLLPEKGRILSLHDLDKQGNPQEVAFDSVNITAVSGKLPAEALHNDKNHPSYKLALATTEAADVKPKPLTTNEIIGDAARRTGLGGLEAFDDIRLLVCPDLMAGLPMDGKLGNDDKKRIFAVQKAMDAQCQRLKYRFAILDTPPGLSAQEVKAWRSDLGIDSSYSALYYPWLEVADFSGQNGRTKLVPPSGYIAGVYNRVDGERGVHKAPANEAPLGVVGLERDLTRGEQDTLNPNGVNCLRRFPGGRGIKIWGGRTLSTEGAWRYINVRRLFITVAASLDAGLQWVVFEPNDRILWARVRRDIRAFLSTFWLNGALFGSTQDEAFYVKCDDELNPPAIRDLGQLIIEVGLCPVKPAEFVILRLSQWAGPNAESE